jgi:hypothetical protein
LSCENKLNSTIYFLAFLGAAGFLAAGAFFAADFLEVNFLATDFLILVGLLVSLWSISWLLAS